MNRQGLLEDLFGDIACIGRRVIPFASSKKSSSKSPTRAQLGILFCVFYSGPHTIKELSERFGMTPSAITQIVNSLVDDGLLSRQEDEKDRRKLHISLTLKGKKKIESIKKSRMKSFAQMFQSLSDSDLVNLKNIYSKIIPHLK